VTSIPNEGDLESSKYTSEVSDTRLTVAVVEDIPEAAVVNPTPAAETTAKPDISETAAEGAEQTKADETNPTVTSEGATPKTGRKFTFCRIGRP